MVGQIPDWRAIYDTLSRLDRSALVGEDLDTLADSLFWLDRPDESIAVRGRAFTAHVEGGDQDAAAMSAWRLFYDHSLVGEHAQANGWLARARRCAGPMAGTPTCGFLAVAEADRAAADGALADADDHARRAVEIGRSTGDADLLAMALQTRGRLLVAARRHDEAVAAFDEAMVAVINGELGPLYTGWVFCNALSTCHDVADLDRAVEWSEAATRWCAELGDGQLYPGICRLHVVELACLRGAWPAAAEQAQRACDELTSHDPRFAGEAHYLIGELHRLTGELDLAEESFARAHQLGRVPQPGLGRVRMAQGRIDDARRALRLALGDAPASPMRRSELLVAVAEADVAAGDVSAARAAVEDLVEVAGEVPSEYLRGLALATEAAVLHAEGDSAAAYRCAGDAAAAFQRLGLPYDEARARARRGAAASVLGEDDTACLELTAARDSFERLGAEPDARRAAGLLGQSPASPLSEREAEVLRLVARGGTNREIADELVLSEHTVARHLSNIYTKLGVGSRSAATAFAYEHSLI